eukprot:3500350-Rhodomonas_salina.1
MPQTIGGVSTGHRMYRTSHSRLIGCYLEGLDSLLHRQAIALAEQHLPHVSACIGLRTREGQEEQGQEKEKGEEKDLLAGIERFIPFEDDSGDAGILWGKRRGGDRDECESEGERERERNKKESGGREN